VAHLGKSLFLVLCLVVILTFVVGFDKPRIIVIDPGHQEKADSSLEPDAPNSKVMKPKTTSGATGVSTKQPEYKLNLEVSLLLRDELRKRGFQVIMIRETNNVKISNSERANIANQANADLFIRVHADGSEDGGTHGISILYPSKNVRYADEEKKMASAVLEQTIKETKANSRGIVKRSDLSGFNWSKVPTILIEMGFLSNVNEDKKMATSNYQQSLAVGMANGIEQHFTSNVKNAAPNSQSTDDTYKGEATPAPKEVKAEVTPTPSAAENPKPNKVETEAAGSPLEQQKLETERPQAIAIEANPLSPSKVNDHTYIKIIAFILLFLAVIAILVKRFMFKKKN
jgi:N-acetylmuramoyl-L-alanine amidase